MYLKYVNPKWHEKTEAVQKKFQAVWEELELQRSKLDREVFYEEMEKLNYKGVDRFFCSPTKRFVGHINNALEHKFKFKEEFVSPTKLGQQYSNFEKSYIVEPVGKGLNYKLIETKPLKFYDQVLNQDVIKKKVYHDPAAALNETQCSAVSTRYKQKDEVHELGGHGNLLGLSKGGRQESPSRSVMLG